MTACCDPRGCDLRFDTRFAARMAARYRTEGLDPTARRIVELVAGADLAGVTVLEIGGGVGEIGLELLRLGATSATNLELSPGYEAEAAALIAEAGLTGRVDRRLGDIAVDHDVVEPADVVILHRVVCCYPDHAQLLATAADHARRQVVFSFPPRNAVTRTIAVTRNAVFGLTGRRFRSFAHPPAAMLSVLADRGLSPLLVHRGREWQVASATRCPVG